MGTMSGAKQPADAEGLQRGTPSATATDADDRPPKRLGRYRIGERVGRGGTAEVYRVEVEGAEGFAKTLVVKCLRPALADEPELVQGLAREAKLAQRLHHGNIVQVLDFGVEDGRPYVVMEHVDGCSLHELLADLRRRGEHMGLPEALYVVEEVAAALRYAHALTDDHGVPLRLVHRDVKPRNVLVSREGVVKLADFGIAKLADDHGDTLPGVIKGTPAWLAPEQALGRGVDARTDMYALGLLLRELCGEGREGQPRSDPRVDEALREIWRRASADAPEDRFADAQAMLGALQRWRAARELDATPGQVAAWVRRARKQAPVARTVALDAALLGASERDVTIASAAQDAVLASHGAPRRSRGWIGLAAAVAIAGIVIAVWLGDRNASSEGTTPSGAARAEADPSDSPLPTPEGSLPSSPRAPALAPDPPPAPPDHAAPRPTLSADSSPDLLPAPAYPATSRTPDPVARKSEPRTPPREPGRLQVNVLPWAEVSVDGRSLGRVPVDVELAPGRHRVQLSNPQLGERTLEVEVPAGGVHTISRW
jgi:serine/threonine protein kinase